MYDIAAELKQISKSGSDEEVKDALSKSLGLSSKRSLSILLDKLADVIQQQDQFVKSAKKYVSSDLNIPDGKNPVYYNLFHEDYQAYEDNRDEAVCFGDRLTIVTQAYSPHGVYEHEITGELQGVAYGSDGFIEAVLVYDDNNNDNENWWQLDFDGLFYKA